MALPDIVVATGWIPFLIILILTIIFSWLYMRYYQSQYDSDLSATLTSVIAFSLALLTSAAVPVDVFLVSYMKNFNGTFKIWAEDNSTRQNVEETMLHAYYTLYGLVFLFLFFVIPLVYFSYEESNDDQEQSIGSRLCTGLKYTSLFLFVFLVLILIGIFIPLKNAPERNGTEWEKFKFLINRMDKNHGENLFSFLLCVLNIIGMLILIVYTGYGMSVWPCGMIKGWRNAFIEQTSVANQRAIIQGRINAIKEKYEDSQQKMPRWEQRHFNRLEEEEKLLLRREKHLNDATRSCLYKCLLLYRPFQIVLGFIFSLLGLFIFLSLLLTNIDKALYSLGPMTGYLLSSHHFPNFIDYVLTKSQQFFPLDYVLFVIIVSFFVIASMSGVKNIGIRFLWLKMYKIRPYQTKPQGLLLMCMTMMYIILALNVIMYLLIPEYTTYGSQHYMNETYAYTDNSTMKVVRCSIQLPPEECVMTQISHLLQGFFFKAWYFGVFYYWASWVFLLVILLGSFYSLYKAPEALVERVDEDDFEESDEELMNA